MPDDRSAGQRRHDAVLEAGLRLLRSGALPHTAGVPVTVLLHLGADDLRDPDGVAPTDHGVIGPVQRFALAARDGGCCFPGCTRPPAWTQAHHVREWEAHEGPTDIDNLCLICRWHHREFGRRGWQVTMTDGIPEWLPPSWLDPERRPIRNTAHHQPDLEFAVDGVSKYADTG